MIAQWTTRKAPLSRLISRILGGPSHFSLAFPAHHVVIHSHLPTVDVESQYSFAKKNRLVRSLKYVGPKSTDLVYVHTLKKYIDKPYDVGALVFGLIVMSVRGLRNVVKTNMWASKDAKTCHELAEVIEINEMAPDVDWPDSIDAITLRELYDILESSKYWEKVKP